jgi:glycosyltransferase involved in cell wall biosynthesis
VFRYGISSNKLFDYMASGLPIISACATAYDPVERAETGVSINPGDAPALAEAMLSMASRTAADRAAMGARGLAYLSREHDLDGLADRFADLLIDLRGDLADGGAARQGQ